MIPPILSISRIFYHAVKSSLNSSRLWYFFGQSMGISWEYHDSNRGFMPNFFINFLNVNVKKLMINLPDRSKDSAGRILQLVDLGFRASPRSISPVHTPSFHVPGSHRLTLMIPDVPNILFHLLRWMGWLRNPAPPFWDGWNPWNNGINHLSTGDSDFAGPSTVWLITERA